MESVQRRCGPILSYLTSNWIYKCQIAIGSCKVFCRNFHHKNNYFLWRQSFRCFYDKTRQTRKKLSVVSLSTQADFMKLHAKEVLEKDIHDESFPLTEFLTSCPSRVLSSCLAGNSTEVLEDQVVRARLPTISFFQFQIIPCIDLKYHIKSSILLIESTAWELKGLEAFGSLKDKFDLNLFGELRAVNIRHQPKLRGKAELHIKLLYSSPLVAIPRNVVEAAGQKVTETILFHVKSKIATNVVSEFYRWQAERHSTDKTLKIGQQ